MFLEEYEKTFKADEDAEKNELKLQASVRYWREVLFEKTIRIFEWQGLPFPQREIEMRLLLNGFCGFVNDIKAGLMVASGSMSGPTEYFDVFKSFTYAAPTAWGGTKKIGKNCVLMNNTALRNSIYPLVFRYACLLAHCDVSLKMSLVNLRMKNIVVSDDESSADTFKNMYQKFYEGDAEAFVDNAFTDAKNIATTMSGTLGVMDCIDARNELLRMFYNDIGVRYTRDKKERMIESEVSNDSQMLLFNISDMLHQREKASKEINTMFGLKTSVKLSKEFELIEKGGSTNGNDVNGVSDKESD